MSLTESMQEPWCSVLSLTDGALGCYGNRLQQHLNDTCPHTWGVLTVGVEVRQHLLDHVVRMLGLKKKKTHAHTVCYICCRSEFTLIIIKRSHRINTKRWREHLVGLPVLSTWLSWNRTQQNHLGPTDDGCLNACRKIRLCIMTS